MKKLRVLLADEHPPLLHHLSALLSDDFCVVGTVSDGKALLAAALELKPEVIISDIDMPIMNGLEAVRQLKALLPSTKVIFLTNHKEHRNLRGRIRAVVRDLQTAPAGRYARHSLFGFRQDKWMSNEKGVA